MKNFLSYRQCLGLDKPQRYFEATITRTHTFVDNAVLTAAQLNNEFDNALNALAIVNADISGSAAIAGSKLANPLTGVSMTTPTITNPVMNAINPTAQTYTPAGGGTATLDISLGNEHRITMPAGNITIAVSNDTNAQRFIVSITQDSVGSRTVTWFSTIKWAGGSAPTLTTTANKRDCLGFIRTGSGTYDGFIIGQNI